MKKTKCFRFSHAWKSGKRPHLASAHRFQRSQRWWISQSSLVHHNDGKNTSSLLRLGFKKKETLQADWIRELIISHFKFQSPPFKTQKKKTWTWQVITTQISLKFRCDSPALKFNNHFKFSQNLFTTITCDLQNNLEKHRHVPNLSFVRQLEKEPFVEYRSFSVDGN